MLYDKDSRKYKLIFSGRKQIGGCLGEEVRREELIDWVPSLPAHYAAFLFSSLACFL